MPPRRGLGRAQREKIRLLGYLFGHTVARHQDHRRDDRAEVDEHNRGSAQRNPHLFEDFVCLTVSRRLAKYSC